MISQTIIIVDDESRIIGILAGRPGSNRDWEEVCSEAEEELIKVGDQVGGRSGPKVHRRGAFATLCTGFSVGGGQKQPMNFATTKTKAGLVDELNKKRCFRRIAGFGSCKITFSIK